MSYLSHVARFGAAAKSLPDFDQLSARERIAWVAGRYGHKAILSSGFGPQSAVLLHMVSQLAPGMRIVDVDTQHRWDETEAYKESLLRDHLPHLDVRTYRSPETRAEQFRKYGDPAEFDESQLADHLRRNKTEPMSRALKDLHVRVWISGRRRAHHEDRQDLEVFEARNGILHLNPIVDWSDEQVRDYREQYGLPEHPLGAMGFTRIGEYFEPLGGKGICPIFTATPVSPPEIYQGRDI